MLLRTVGRLIAIVDPRQQTYGTGTGCAALATTSHGWIQDFLTGAQKRVCYQAVCDLGNRQRRNGRRVQQGFDVGV